ncbi:DUF309 domain-containing protein [Salibacterium aidingense]|uniref:DUF309 domain-containing protein n=1 Tax=Salibacterium aidingense TaxID=384933 RepID=UPI003BC1943A
MYPEAYVQFLVQFHAHRDYFECHEILEEFWKETDPGNRLSLWVGLIQTAVGLYHHRRENFRGAEKIFASAHSILQANTDSLLQLGLDAETLLDKVDQCLTAARHRNMFQDINLPITDPGLTERCRQECDHQQVTWLNASDLTNKQLIHRHILRHHSGREEGRIQQKRNI